MTQVYYDDFQTWQDVQNTFVTKDKEPEKVLYARAYISEGDYSSAEVAYYDGGMYWFVTGRNIGDIYERGVFEGQWFPTGFDSKLQLVHTMQKMAWVDHLTPTERLRRENILTHVQVALAEIEKEEAEAKRGNTLRPVKRILAVEE